MAFQDIFDETRKKLSGYFGVGRPGLGTFGQQVKNTFKPVANLATRKLPSFNAFNTARQQMPRFQGVASNIARSQVQREIQPRINAVRNTINLADTAGRFVNRNLNPMSEHNIVPRALNYISKGMTPMPNEANTRDRFQRILGAGTDIVTATNPLLNVATTADKFLSSKTNKQRLGSIAEGTANALLGGKGQIAIDALGRGLGKNIVKSAGKTVIRNMPRNLATGALYGGGSALRQDKSAKEIAKDSLSGAIAAQGMDMLLSPRVTYGLSRELFQKPVSKAADTMMRPVVSAMGAMPKKGFDALSNEAKPDLYGARQRLEREASNLQKQIKPAIENAKKDAKGNMLPSEQKRIQALIDSWDNKLSEIKTINNTMESQLSPQSTPSALSNEARKVFHGTTADVTDLKPGSLVKRGEARNLLYVTEDKNIASEYGKSRAKMLGQKDGKVIPLQLNGRVIKGEDYASLEALTKTPEFQRLSVRTQNQINNVAKNKSGILNATIIDDNPELANFLKEQGIAGVDTYHPIFKGKNDIRQIVVTDRNALSPQSTQGAKKTAKAEAEFQKVSDELLDRPIPKNNVKVMNPTAQMADEALGKSETLKGNYKNILGELVNNRNVAKTRGAQKVLETNIPYDEAQATIKGLDGTGAHTGTSQMFRQQFDEAYKAAQDAGLDVGYIDDYLTHIWKEDPKIVKEKFAAVTQNFKFSEGRTIPTYEEGIKLGLKPKYDTPQQILGHYTQKLEEVKANIGFFNRLKDEGFIVPASVGANNPSFKAITGAGFPKSTSYVGKNSRVIGAWYAPREIADDIDKVFGIKESPKWLETTAKISGGVQDLLLSGGIPKTPLNAFTFAQITKEVLGGNYKSPLKSFATALSGQKTNKFLADNVEQIVKMQKNGINLRSSFGLEDLADRGTIKNVFGSSIGEGWDKFMSDPTFKRFMPMLQVNMFNAVERGAIKAGRSADEAAQVAAQAVKNFYGLNDAVKEVTRSKVTNNLLTTFAFAPKYRESMINFWINNVKAIKSPLAPENRNNVIFGLGAIVTYAGMDQANLAINGVHMKDNPKGKEDKLLIPLGNGKTVGIPYLSSIATVPRSAYRAGKALYEGDVKGAAQEGLKSNLSAGLKPLVEVAANENYFGEEIYDDYDTTGQKWGKVANYLVNPATGAYGHPYIREGVKYAQKKQGAAETVSKATEMPLRWYNTKSIENAGFWEANDTQKQIAEIEKQAKYGKIPAQTAQKQIQSLTSKRDKQLTKPTSNVAKADSGQDSRIRDLGGYYGITTSKGTDFADTYEDAQKALAKDDFDKSGKKSATINGTYFYRKENGDIGSYTEAELNFKVRDQQMEKAKENNNYGAWTKLAQEKQKDLEQQWKDADGDPLAQLEIENKLIDLYQSMAKYASYGGFKKGKKGKKIKFSAFDSSTTSGIKIPISKATKPNFKKITSTPKIPVSTKARGITKSYLANLR